MSDIKANVEFDVKDLKDALSELHGSIEEIVESLGKGHDKFMKNTSEQADALRGVTKAAHEMGKEIETQQDHWYKGLQNIGSEYEKMIKSMRSEGGVGGIIAEGLPSQLVGMQSAVQKAKSDIFAELPFGGLIGLMILGGKRDADVAAMGAQAARVFQQTSQVGRAEMAQVASDAKSLGIALGKGPTGMTGEFMAAGAAIAQFGVDVKEVLTQKFSVPIKNSRGDLLETSLALDAFFGQASGTAARQMGELIKDFNINAGESAKVVAAIGINARDTGSSVQAFTSSIMRSATALRTQRVDVTEIMEVQMKYAEVLRNSPEFGLNKQAAAGKAERGIEQVSQGLAGMNIGLTTYLGERMSQRGAMGSTPVSGLDSYYAMQNGFQGKGQDVGEQGIFMESIKELLKLTKETSDDKSTQRYFLQTMGFGVEGSQALMSVMDKIDKTGTDDNSINKAIASSQKDLSKAFVDRGEETSKWQRDLLAIQNGIAQVGSGLLGMMVAGLTNIYDAIRYGITFMPTADKSMRGFYEREMDIDSRAATKSAANLGHGMDNIGRGLLHGVDDVLGAGGIGGRAQRWNKFAKDNNFTSVEGKFYSPDSLKNLVDDRRGKADVRASHDFTSNVESLLKGSDFQTKEVKAALISAMGRGGGDKVGEMAMDLAIGGKITETQAKTLRTLAYDAENSASGDLVHVDGDISVYVEQPPPKVRVKRERSHRSKSAETGK